MISLYQEQRVMIVHVYFIDIDIDECASSVHTCHSFATCYLQ